MTTAAVRTNITNPDYGADALNPGGYAGQTNYDRYAEVGILGMLFDSSFDDKISLLAYEAIGLGLGLVQMITDIGRVCRLPRANKTILVLSVHDLEASNKVDLKINGTSMGEVTYSGSHATSMGLVVTALKAMDDVENAVLDTTDTANRTILIYSVDGKDCLVTAAAVTGGTNQGTLTATVTSTDAIAGISMQTQGKEQDLGTLVLNYKANDAVNTLHRGRIWVKAEVAVSAMDPVYVRLQDGTITVDAASVTVTRGMFRNDSDSGNAILVPGAVWFQGTTDNTGGYAVIEINLPR